MSLEAFRLLTIALKPVLPALARTVEAFLGIAPLRLGRRREAAAARAQPISAYKHLMQRVDPKQIDALFEANREALRPAPEARGGRSRRQGDGRSSATAAKPKAHHHRRFREDRPAHREDRRLRGGRRLGQAAATDARRRRGRTRNVFSGIKSAYQPEDLVGKLTVMVANLAPRKMKFGVSRRHGAGGFGRRTRRRPGPYILEPHSGAKPGMRVK